MGGLAGGLVAGFCGLAAWRLRISGAVGAVGSYEGPSLLQHPLWLRHRSRVVAVGTVR